MLRHGRYCLTMHRIGSLPAICVLALAVALGACSDDSGPTPPEDAEVPAAIQALIDELFPEGNLRDSATSQVAEVLERADGGQTAEAQARYFDFVAFGAAQAQDGALLDPGGAGAPTIEDALADLSDAVADAAGLSVPSIPGEAFAADGAVAVLDEAGGTVVTGSGTGGLMLPAGALPGETLITIVRIPETGDPADHDGPLPTDLPQYPRFYDISTFPPVATLFQSGVVGLCVVDPPDPFAPTPDVAARLRIAHPAPGDPQSIQILPLVEAAFLDCTGGDGGLALASPGAIGGRISSFSPFAAVERGDSPPAITSVTPNPVLASTAGGTVTPIDVGFREPDGDLDVLRIVEISDPEGAFNPSDIDVSDLLGETAGTFEITTTCDQVPPATCQTGTVLVDFVLVDAAENESEPFRVTIVFE
jgi:hypothetical protein